MIIGKKVKAVLASEFSRYQPDIALTTGESVRMAREFNQFSQNELALRTGLTQATISGIENGRISLGVERAKNLARALKVHPSVLLFPGWDTDRESIA